MSQSPGFMPSPMASAFASPNHGYKQIQLVKFVVEEIDGFQDQWRRSYNTNASGDAISKMHQRFENALASQRSLNPENIGSSIFAGVASDFLVTDATPTGQIGIVNGWGQRRFRFVLEVNVVTGTGIDVYVLQGYSDHNDRSFSGLFDPKTMLFHVNSITKLRTVRTSAGYGGAQQVNRFVADSTHILVDPNYGNYESLLSPTAQNLSAITPTDVFRTMGLMEAGMDNHSLGSEIIDTSTVVTGMPRPSRRGNALPSEFSGKILQGFVAARQKSMFGDDGPALYTDAVGLTAEEAFTTNDFFRALMNATHRPMSDSFCYNDLLMLDPTLADRSQIVEAAGMGNVALPGSSFAFQTSYSENWNGTDYETTAAVHIVNALPALLIRFGVTVLHFTATNRNMGGTTILITDVSGFDMTVLEQSISALKTHLEVEILQRISMNNSVGYDVEVRCEIMGKTNVMFSYDGRTPVGYVAPTFADSLTVPVTTQDNERLSSVSWDFRALCDELVSVDKNTSFANGPVSGFNAGFSSI